MKMRSSLLQARIACGFFGDNFAASGVVAARQVLRHDDVCKSQITS